jgi:hypothetical protein
MTTDFIVKWVDGHREPQCEPDPMFPQGKDLCIATGEPSCGVALPYPAKRCGLYIVECKKCGLRIGVTTAGRPDDPRSVRMTCAAAFH